MPVGSLAYPGFVGFDTCFVHGPTDRSRGLRSRVYAAISASKIRGHSFVLTPCVAPVRRPLPPIILSDRGRSENRTPSP